MFVRGVVCALVGLAIGSDDAPVLGFIVGGALGLLWGQFAALEQTVVRLRRDLDARPLATTPPIAPAPAEPDPVPRPSPIAPAAAPAAAPIPRVTLATSYEPAVAPAPHPQWDPPDATAERRVPPAPPAVLERVFGAAKDWMLTGNIPVKVGVILSFIGVAFLLKYAVDEGLLSFPIELRLSGIAAAALVLLGFGWRLREKDRTYALTIQGGGIGILFLTVFAAFRLYHLLPPAAAFTILVLLTAGLAALAVLQRAQSLAVFGVVGGFAAPLLISTGTGSHVALFSYYLVLNLAIAAIAWFMAWRPLNWLGFVCTYAVGTAWGFPYYQPEHFATVEPFLIVHFLLYTAIAVVFALRHGPQLKGYVDGTLIFGLPLVSFALQWELVEPWQRGQAFSALALAGFYVALAALMLRRASSEARLLAECFIALAVGFATIAIPLALDAQWTSATWALEGAGLVWVAVRQGRLLSRWSGVALQLLAAFTLLGDYDRIAADPLFLNGRFLGGLMLALGAGVSARFLERGPQRHPEYERIAVGGLFGLALIAWYATGLAEIGHHAPEPLRLAIAIVFVLGSAAAALALGSRLASPMLAATAAIALPALAVLALRAATDKTHPAADLGWAAWPLAFALHAWITVRYRAIEATVCRALALGGLWLGALLLAWEARFQLDRIAEGAIWGWAGVVATFAVLAHLVGQRRLAPRWPALSGVGDGTILLAALLLGAGLLIGSRADPAPLPFVPLLNPLDLAVLYALLVAGAWYRAHGASFDIDGRQVALVVTGFGFAMITMGVMRWFHHWEAMPFRPSAAFRHDGLQATLSIVWAVLGVSAMSLGARRARRMVWMAGAALMGVVVVKLFLVDLGNTGTVARIVSFIGVGVLLLVIGYFAPLPARPTEKAS